MIKIVMFSGGKDSSCLVHKMLNEGERIKVVFCNTGWELPETLKYIDEFNKLYLDGELTTLKNEKYDGMKDLIYKKNYMPTVHQRFCTEELKINPLKEYVKKFRYPFELFNGVRAEESLSRRNLTEEVFDEFMQCWVKRPLLSWTSVDVFNYLRDNEVIINPLYKKGMKRVGCGPCIMISLKELAVLKETHPERIDEIREIEAVTKQQFFQSNFIPERFRTSKSSRGNARASIDDVTKYLDSKEKYFEISEQVEHSCMSYYGLCE